MPTKLNYDLLVHRAGEEPLGPFPDPVVYVLSVNDTQNPDFIFFDF
jgi:hypothetical protein